MNAYHPDLSDTIKSTDWKALLINGRAPQAGEPFAEEYSRRFARWTAQQVAAGNVKVTPWGSDQAASDYRSAAS